MYIHMQRVQRRMVKVVILFRFVEIIVFCFGVALFDLVHDM